MTLHRYFLFLPWALALLLSIAGMSHAGSGSSGTSLKAEHILKFAHYVEWPTDAFEHPASPIIIGVLNASPLADELERISANQQIEGRPVMVKRLTADNLPGTAHILYLGEQPLAKSRDRLNTAIRHKLSVCDASHDQTQACAIRFVQDSHRLRFDISVPVAERSGVRIMAPLLTVARKVHE